jgi:hypothetical protein
MNHPQEPFLPETDGYNIFIGRIVGLWLMLVFIALWAMGQLPHQLPVNEHGWVQSGIGAQLASLLPTTLCIFFLIVPSRKLAFICILCMIFLLISYHGRNQALKLSVFPLIFFPFLDKKQGFKNAWKWTCRFILLSFLFSIPVITVSYTAIPVYTLLTTAFIPWERTYRFFVQRFEPK